jgi:small subunit ribosomal protein S19
MSRSLWKGPYIDKTLLQDLSSKLNSTDKKNTNFVQLETQSRQSTIIPKFTGVLVKVHNGRKFISLRVTSEMVGYKFGEFVPTRQKFFYKKTKNK